MIAPYHLIEELLPRHVPFTGNSMSAFWVGDTYCVLSYQTCIARYNQSTGEVWLDDTFYSMTTSRHQGYVRRAWNLEKAKVKR